MVEIHGLTNTTGALTLDFGDCYAGNISYRQLTFYNISDRIPLDISLASDQPESGEITFEHFFDKSGVVDTSNPSTSSLTNEMGDSSSTSTQNPSDSLTRAGSSSDSLITPGTQGVGNNVSEGREENLIIGTRRNPSSGATETDSGAMTTIDELMMTAGSSRTIRVRYCPQPDLSKPGRLSTRNMRLFLSVRETLKNNLPTPFFSSPSLNFKERRKNIKVTSKVCLSLIEVANDEINLGDCNIGSWKSAAVALANNSDLPAYVAVRYESKVISFQVKKEEVVVIPPKQMQEFMFDFVPRKTNPDYRKQVTFANLRNPNNDQFAEIRAINVDQHGVMLHSLFYHLITPFSRNYINFDNVIVNSPVVRVFVINNTSITSELELQLKSTLPDEIKLYTPSTTLQHKAISRNSDNRHELLLQSLEESNKNKTNRDQQSILRRVVGDSYLDLAGLSPKVSGKKRSSFQGETLRGSPVVTPASALLSNDSETRYDENHLFSLAQSFENSSSAANQLFVETEEEQKQIAAQVKRLKGVAEAIRENLLIPAERVHLEKNGKCSIFVVFTASEAKRPWLEGKLKKIEAKVLIQLVEYDRELLQQQKVQTKKGG
jgi:hypothetical protein